MLPLQTSLSAGRTRKPQKGEHGGGLLGVYSTQRGQSICTAYPGGGGSTEALGKVLCSVPTAHRCHPWDAPQMPQKEGEAHVLGQAESPPGGRQPVHAVWLRPPVTHSDGHGGWLRSGPRPISCKRGRQTQRFPREGALPPDGHISCRLGFQLSACPADFTVPMT